MSNSEPPRSDGLADVIMLLAAPLANAVRTYDQFRRGVEEMFRTLENLNTTMENLNETSVRINRLIGDIEEPVRTMIPQLRRAVSTADEVLTRVGRPAMKAAPHIERVVETLSSPSFTALPSRIDELVTIFGDASKRLGPLASFAESASGLFGIRIPGATPALPSGPDATASETANAKSPPSASPAPPRKAGAAKKKVTAKKKAAAKKTASKKKPAGKKPPAAKRAGSSAASAPGANDIGPSEEQSQD